MDKQPPRGGDAYQVTEAAEHACRLATEIHTMTRSIGIVVAITTILIVAGIHDSHAQAPPVTAKSQTPLDEAKQLTALVEKLFEEGKYQESMVPAARALAIWERALGHSHPDVAESLNNLAFLYRVQGAYAKAEPPLARALAINEKALPGDPLIAAGLNNLAALYKDQGAYAEAEPLYTRALAIGRHARPA
jgi:tetratricopeptide (TPR) repeat protein